MKVVKTLLVIILLALIALPILWWAPFPPEAHIKERLFQSRIRMGMSWPEAVAAAKSSGGTEFYGGSWSDPPTPGYEHMLEVAFGYATSVCTAHWTVIYMRFSEQGRLENWWPSEQDTAC